MTSTLQASPRHTVVTDTNVLINFIHGKHLGLLGQIKGYRFSVPCQVKSEVTWPDQSAALDSVMSAGQIDACDADDIGTRRLYRELCELIEDGEAACIAIAATEGHSIATDERRDAKRIAIELLGCDRLLRTEDVVDQCIRSGLLTIAEADDFKRLLESKRYKMSFSSFADRIAA